MDIYLRLDEPDTDALLELAHWLAQDHRLPDEARTARHVAAAGHMGASLDVLELVIGNGIALGALLVSLAQWRQSRPVPPVIRVSAHRPDGTTVTVETNDPRALAEAVRQWDDI